MFLLSFGQISYVGTQGRATKCAFCGLLGTSEIEVQNHWTNKNLVRMGVIEQGGGAAERGKR